MFVCAACLNTNSEGAQKLLEQCDPKRFLLVELDVRKSASILHIEKTVMNLLTRHADLGKRTQIAQDSLSYPAPKLIAYIHRIQLSCEQCRCHVFR